MDRRDKQSLDIKLNQNKNKDMKYLKKELIFKRIGFVDVVVPYEHNGENLDPDGEIIGYEDENGDECSEDGKYYDQNIEFDPDTMYQK